MDLNNKFKVTSANSSDSDEINLKLVLNFILRNKILISSVAVISFCLFYLFSLTIKRTWRGEFQIVLNSENESSTSIASVLSPGISSLILGNEGGELATEVGILKSPSLLLPIFEFVESKKSEENSTYTDWKKQLDVELQLNTSILNIGYEDKQKDLILPVLNKLSLSYQDFSGRKDRRENELTKNYLNNAITFYKQKSLNSFSKGQQFAIDENLEIFEIPKKSSISIGNIPPNSNVSPSTLNSSIDSSAVGANSDIEKIRVNSLNRIKKIDLQLKQLEDIDLDAEKLKYIVSTIPLLMNDKANQKLDEIDQEIIKARLKYTDQDKMIQILLDQKDILNKFLKKRVISFLNAEKIENETLMKSSTRPKEVLITYKNLMREASRDEITLVALEEQKRVADLRAAKLSDPWELITKPTLLIDPVAPRRRSIALSGFALGILMGILTAKYKEKKSGKIYETKILENISSAPILEKVNIKLLMDKKDESCLYLREFIRCNPNKRYCIFALSEFDKEYLSKLKERILNSSELKKINNLDVVLDNNKLDKFITASERFLIVSLKNADLNKMQEFNQNLQSYNIDISGLILLENF